MKKSMAKASPRSWEIDATLEVFRAAGT